MPNNAHREPILSGKQMNLCRITARGRWIPEIDGLRLVAIAATLLVPILNSSTPLLEQLG